MGYRSKYTGKEVEQILDNAISDAPNDGMSYVRENRGWKSLDSTYKGIQQQLEEKANTKDVYNKQQVNELIASVPVYDDVPLKAELNTKVDSDKVYTKQESDSLYIKNELDPTVPAWAKEKNKPTYTASEVGAIPFSMLSQLSQMSFVTLEEYENVEKVPNRFYICIEDDELLKIYLGNFLIAEKGDIPTSGFPYTLPIVF